MTGGYTLLESHAARQLNQEATFWNKQTKHHLLEPKAPGWIDAAAPTQ